MASTSYWIHDLNGGDYFRLHGSGVANCGSYPEIEVDFKITFTRSSATNSLVTWEISDIDWHHPTTGTFGFEFISNVSINGASLSGANEIIAKNNITAENWWNATTLLEPSGSFRSTGSTTTIKFYVEERHCTNDGNFCYDDGESDYYIAPTLTVNIPTYTSDYDVEYDANGGGGAPESQKKTAGHFPLKLSEQVPYWNLAITYHNDTTTVTSVGKQFINWQSYYSRNTSHYRVKFTGDGVTTTFPSDAQGFDPKAYVIEDVKIRGWSYTWQLVNNHIVISPAPTSGESFVVTYSVKPTYSNPGSTYNPGDNYTVNSNAYMVAQWGAATFTPIAPTAHVYGVVFEYNGGTGSPASKLVPREVLGYATTQGGTKVYDVGVASTTTTDLDLYPLYGDAILLYSELPTPTKQGFRFDGWYRESTFVNKVTTDLTLTQSIILYAKWVALPIYQMQLDGTWKPIGPYVWKMNSNNQWEKVAHVYRFDGEHWIDISD